MVDQVYANAVRRVLVESIDALNANKQYYVLNPDKDFQRERKIPFDTMVNILLQMENRSLQTELLNYYNHDPDVPTKSAFCQQRKKLRAEAMAVLFSSFTKEMISLDTPKTTKEGYLVLACDGSDINIPYNPDDTETYHQNANKRGYNQLHLNALYDVYNGVYADVVLEPDRKSHERDAFIKMVDRYDLPYPAIFLADRGYEGYNVFAHLLSSGQKFVIRLKDNYATNTASLTVKSAPSLHTGRQAKSRLTETPTPLFRTAILTILPRLRSFRLTFVLSVS